MVQRSFEIGRNFLAIRTNADEVAEWMDVLSAYEVHDEDAEPYLSIWLGERLADSRGFHIYYRESQRHLRTHDLGAIAHCSVSQLETYTLQSDRSALHLDLAVIRRGGRSARSCRRRSSRSCATGRTHAERALHLPTAGVRLARPRERQAPAVPRRLDVPAGAVEQLAALDPEGSGTQPDVEIPEVPDIACVFLNSDMPVRRVPLVQAVYAMSQNTLNLGQFGRDGLDALSRLLEPVPIYAFTPDSAAAMLAEVVAVLDGAVEVA